MSFLPGNGNPTEPRATVSVTYGELQRLVFLVFALLAVWNLAAALTTILLFFLSIFILAAVINPVAVFMQRFRVPRIVSALGVALLLLVTLFVLRRLALPPLIDEATRFATNLPAKQATLEKLYHNLVNQYPELARHLPPADQIARDLTPRISALATTLVGTIGRYTANMAAGIFSVLFAFVLVIYTVAHPVPLLAGLLGATPDRYRARMESAIRRILTQLKNWAFGSLVLGVIVGVMTGVGLSILGAVMRVEGGFPYVLLFSVIAGLGEMVPSIGPVISAVPPALIALTIDPMLALWVLVLFIIIQQLENNLIVPLVMGQSLNLHPVSILFAVIMMGALFGLLGAVLAVPVSAIIKVCWEEFFQKPRGIDVAALEAAADRILTEGSADPRDQPAKPVAKMPRALRIIRQRRAAPPPEEPSA